MIFDEQKHAVGDRVVWWSNTGVLNARDAEILEDRWCEDDRVMIDRGGRDYVNDGGEWVYRTSAEPGGFVFERYLAANYDPARGEELAALWASVYGGDRCPQENQTTRT